MAVIALLLVTGVTMSGSALAQSTATPTETETQEETSVIQIDESVTVTDYSFEGEKITVIVEAGYAQTVVISDMFVSGTGAQNIEQKRLTVNKGKNEITMQVTAYKGLKGATVATSGGAVALSEETGGTYFTSSYSSETLMIMLITGILTGIGLVMGIAYKKELDYTSDIKREL